MFNLRIPVFEAIEVEEEEVLVFDFLADSNMVPGGGDGNALNGFDVV